jgi:hypothetical protein
MRLSEFTHHLWDVKVAFDPTATLNAEAIDLLFDRGEQFLAYIAKPDALGGRQVTLAVHLTSPERSFGLAVRDAVTIVDVPAQPDAVLTAPAEWWLRLVYGRHAPQHTPEGVELTGDTLTLDDLRRVFPGF